VPPEDLGRVDPDQPDAPEPGQADGVAVGDASDGRSGALGGLLAAAAGGERERDDR
jgi:hypothetical protein